MAMTAVRASMERRVIVSAALAHAMTHTLELTFAALLVRIGAQYGVDVAVLGAVANAGTVTFGVTALPSGWLVDRFGPRTVMVAAMWFAGVFALLVAASPSLLFLAAALTLLGAGIGLYHPAGTSMVATVAERRGLGLAAQGIAGNLGVALSPVLAVAISIVFDWRVAYVCFGVAAFLVGLLVLRIAPSRAEATVAVAARARAQAAAPPHRRLTAPPAVRHWLTPALLLIYGSAILQGFIYRGSLTFLTLHLREHLGIHVFGWDPEAVAGAAATLVLLAAVFGQIAGGTLSDRIPVERAVLPFIALTGPFLFLIGPSTGVLLLVACAGFVLMNFAQQPVFNGLITDYSPDGAVGRAFGISFFLTFGLGSFSATFAGMIANRWGTPQVFFALGCVSLTMVVAMATVALGAERRRARHASARARESAAELVAES